MNKEEIIDRIKSGGSIELIRLKIVKGTKDIMCDKYVMDRLDSSTGNLKLANSQYLINIDDIGKVLEFNFGINVNNNYYYIYCIDDIINLRKDLINKNNLFIQKQIKDVIKTLDALRKVEDTPYAYSQP